MNGVLSEETVLSRRDERRSGGGSILLQHATEVGHDRSGERTKADDNGEEAEDGRDR